MSKVSWNPHDVGFLGFWEMKLTSPAVFLQVPSTELPRYSQVPCVAQGLLYLQAPTVTARQTPGSSAQKSLNKDRNGATSMVVVGMRGCSLSIYSSDLVRISGTLDC